MKKNTIITTMIGNILEWYDFAIYAYLAPVIASLFFPSEKLETGLIKTFMVFAIGFLSRPLGGVIFGHIGDKVGRKTALQIAIFMMAIPGVIIGLLPTHDQIGIFAPISLVLMRLLQGLSAGGELMGASTYIFEIAPENRKCFWCSWISFGSIGGMLLGSAVISLIHFFSTPQFFLHMGWRIAFLLSFGCGIIGVIMRKRLKETQAFQALSENKAYMKVPLVSILKTAKKKIVQILFINIFVSISMYLLFVWMPSYNNIFLHKNVSDAMYSNTVAMLLLIMLIPLYAWLTDYFGNKKFMGLTSIFLMLILSYPLFHLIIYGNFIQLLIAQIIFVFAFCGVQGMVLATMNTLLPPNVRYSGTAIGYNIATSLFGGTSPLLCTYLINKLSMLTIPAFFIIASSIIALPAFIFLKEGS